MSRENVEVVRQAYEALSGRDFQKIAALMHPDFELRPGLAGASENAVYRGLDGVRQYVADMAETWERFDQIPERFVDHGDDVVAIIQLDAQGKGSGVELSQRMGVHFVVRDGKAVRATAYLDVDEALEAVGLRE